MMRPLLTASLTLLSFASFGQSARLVINNDAYIVYDVTAPSSQETWLVVTNPATNAITVSGTGGNIISEREQNYLRWGIGATTGIYSVPFTTAAGVKMPLTYQKNTAGTGAGSVVFSTYNFGALPVATAWNNDLYRPSDVTHMHDNATGLVNNSNNVVDRFWIIDTQAPGYAYTTKPDATLAFVYAKADVTTNNLIASTTQVGAQRFNPGVQKWGDFLPVGNFALSVPTGTQNTVSNVVVPNADFYRSWTLSDFNNPLPIELVDLKGDCENDQVVVRWTTASEQNNDYFTIEKSTNGVEWYVIGTVDGAGSSQTTLEYSFVDHEPTGLAYYRLRQTDFDGSSKTSAMFAAGCESDGGISIVNAWDDGSNVNVLVSSSIEGMHDLTLIDAQGKVMVTRPEQQIQNGITHLAFPKNGIATGIYMIQLQNEGGSLNRRIMIQ
ncbi:MAG: T9SS type A sorting domain-containing protein [Flavobacteriales bacterium]|nr:T9SS type A sorting domain-containing protein [Flavobacteriales bacterium]MCB9193295.1 T9SS type A sorting domain-containing protein [Flavobacteriales bacterium]